MPITPGDMKRVAPHLTDGIGNYVGRHGLWLQGPLSRKFIHATCAWTGKSELSRWENTFFSVAPFYLDCWLAYCPNFCRPRLVIRLRRTMLDLHDKIFSDLGYVFGDRAIGI